MAINHPGPYMVEYSIIVGGMVHNINFNCVVVETPVVGQAFGTIDVQTAVVGVTKNLQTATTELWGFLRQLYHTSVTVSSVTLYKVAPSPSLAKTFISASPLSYLAGSNANVYRPAGQLVMSFRSGGGGILKVTLMESSSVADGRFALLPGVGVGVPNTAAYILSAGTWIIARDNGFPVGATYWTAGQNEAIYRKRFR